MDTDAPSPAAQSGARWITSRSFAGSLVIGCALAIGSAMAPLVLPAAEPDWVPFVTEPLPDGTYWAGRRTASVGEELIVACRQYLRAFIKDPIVSPPFWSQTSREPTPNNSTPGNYVADAASGWPMRCLSSSHIGTNVLPPTSGLIRISWTTSWGIPIRRLSDWHLMPPRTIPLRPLPLGLLVCALAWSPVGFALIVGAGHLRARVRNRRGLCAACGYNIIGVTRCPECGVPVA